jgi:hypothetical protein
MLPRDLRDSIGDLVKGTVPLELGLQAPGMGTAGRISGHGAGGGADAGPGRAAERGAGSARRAATSALPSPCPAMTSGMPWASASRLAP